MSVTSLPDCSYFVEQSPEKYFEELTNMNVTTIQKLALFKIVSSLQHTEMVSLFPREKRSNGALFRFLFQIPVSNDHCSRYVIYTTHLVTKGLVSDINEEIYSSQFCYFKS